MIHLILCGGSGTRLWPLSRPSHPKPFLKLFRERSLFQLCYEGNRALTEQCMIVCNQQHKPLVAEQLAELHPNTFSFVLEPVGRNTATALALALHTLPEETLVLATPADAYIGYSEEYYRSVQRAAELAGDNRIVLFGIEPNEPKTEYGYIKAEGEEVLGFHEKPCLEKALSYLLEGNYYWNSGMLCFKVKTMLEALYTHAPEIYLRTKEALINGPEEITDEKMQLIPNISIDHAVCEKARNLKMVPGRFRFSDLGHYDALFEHLEKDASGNALQVERFFALNAKNNLVVSKGKQVAAIDVENLVIIDSGDALLVAKKGSVNKIKEILPLF